MRRCVYCFNYFFKGYEHFHVCIIILHELSAFLADPIQHSTETKPHKKPKIYQILFGMPPRFVHIRTRITRCASPTNVKHYQHSWGGTSKCRTSYPEWRPRNQKDQVMLWLSFRGSNRTRLEPSPRVFYVLCSTRISAFSFQKFPPDYVLYVHTEYFVYEFIIQKLLE